MRVTDPGPSCDIRKKQQQQQQTNFYDFASFYSQIQKAYKTYMRRIGILLGGDPSTVKDRMDEIYDLERKLAKVGFNWVWKDGVQILANSAFRVADKERNPLTFLESRTVF